MWEYRAWCQLALAAGCWRKRDYPASVKKLNHSVMLMGKAARLRSDEYERVRMEGYEMHLRALALRSHAWVCLRAKAYQGALETVKESLRLLAASRKLFPLQRDST